MQSKLKAIAFSNCNATSAIGTDKRMATLH